MKKIFLLILIIISVQSFGQLTRKYGERLNANGSIDSFYVKLPVSRDSVFNYSNEAFTEFTVEYYLRYNLRLPAVFGNFHFCGDGIYRNYIPKSVYSQTTDSSLYSTKANRDKLKDSLQANISLKQNSLGFTPYNATNPSGFISGITGGNVTTALGYTPLNPANNLSDVTAATARTNLGLSTTANISSSTNKNFVTDAQATVIGNTSGSNSGDNSANSTYASDFRAANFVAGTNYLAPNGNGSALTGITEGQVTNLTTDLAAKQATLVSNTNIKTINGATVLGSGDITTTRKVAQADIASTASATSTTTLFTPSASGMYRVSIYLKITTTGTSPVAGPVTITYTEPDGSVAQSHVMLLQSVTGTVVTTTVNNSTTTGTVNGSMIINAKAAVAIQYAIAVSGTFGAGRYMAHITLEAL